MESQHQLPLTLLLFILLLFTKPSTQNNNRHLFSNKINQPTDRRIDCPTCGLRGQHGPAGTSILECKRFYVNHANNNNNINENPNDISGLLPSYKCTCNYTSVNKKECSSKSNEHLYEFGQPQVHGDCLVAHVGMAIRGFNLVHRKWVSKEHCFNLCMRTRLKNGHGFDCTSFEHWHRDCKDSGNGKICATFAESEEAELVEGSSPVREAYGRSYFKQNRYYYTDEVEEKRKQMKNKKRASKPDICVLSNQTISISMNNFLPNDKVTYYEIVCKDSVEASSDEESKSRPPDKQQQKQRTHRTSTLPTEVTATKIPPYLKNILDTQSPTTVARSNKECQFNPCLNGGACLLIDTFRFTCLCKDFYYGVYCEIIGIQKVCHKTLMEITINNEMTTSLNIQPSDLFVNRKSTQLPCQLREVNETHSRFSIPYRMCSTVISNINGETVYANKLFSRIRTSRTSKEQINKNDYLMSLECREATDSIQYWPGPPANTSNTLITHQPEAVTTTTVAGVATTKKKSCLIEMFKLRMRIFFDKMYEVEFSPAINKVEYDQNLNVQFFVEYSDRLNELYQMQKRLQYLHLTLLNCWLTTARNSYDDIRQVLVENGCPEEGVLFYDSTVVKNSIQFSFKIARPRATTDTSQYYLHCEPEICSDSHSTDSPDDADFYRNFKVCENITAMCHAKNVNAEYALMNSRDDLEIKQQRLFKTKANRCNSTLVEGPLFIGRTRAFDNVKAVNSTSAGFKFTWISLVGFILASVLVVFKS